MSEKLELLPVLDIELLQQKATQSAMAGAMKSIEEYYTGYNSPFRKVIEERLKEQQINGSIELPDIIGLINDSLSKQIDEIANSAVAKSFVPLVNRFLTREEKEIKLSDVLRKFVDVFESDIDDTYDFSVNIEEDERYGWLSIKISFKENKYSLTAHQDYDSKKEAVKKYQFLSLPYTDNKVGKMKLKVDGAELEMPFTPDVLKDEFTSYIARLIFSKSLITWDTSEFSDDMFPEQCHCH